MYQQVSETLQRIALVLISLSPLVYGPSPPLITSANNRRTTSALLHCSHYDINHVWHHPLMTSVTSIGSPPNSLALQNMNLRSGFWRITAGRVLYACIPFSAGHILDEMQRNKHTAGEETSLRGWWCILLQLYTLYTKSLGKLPELSCTIQQ